MTQWYYSDYERNRLGPVAASDLADLHRAGQLQPDTLVWREGMANWRAWREVMQIALAEAEGRPHPSQEAAPLSAGVNPYAMAEAMTGKNGDDAGPRSSGVNPYEPAEPRAAASDPYAPYAPPRASLGREHYDYAAGGEVVHAGFLKRLAAYVIDGLVLMVVFMMMMFVGALAGVGLGSLFSPDSLFSGGLGVGLFLIVYGLPTVALFVYFTWMHASSFQATLGKMAVGIKVVDSQGHRLTTGHSLGRFAARFFFYLFSCGVADLVSAFTSGLTERKQALHDMAASTLVVDRWAYTHHAERQRHDLGVVTIIVVSLVGLALLAYLLMFLFVMASGLPS